MGEVLRSQHISSILYASMGEELPVALPVDSSHNQHSWIVLFCGFYKLDFLLRVLAKGYVKHIKLLCLLHVVF